MEERERPQMSAGGEPESWRWMPIAKCAASVGRSMQGRTHRGDEKNATAVITRRIIWHWSMGERTERGEPDLDQKKKRTGWRWKVGKVCMGWKRGRFLSAVFGALNGVGPSFSKSKSVVVDVLRSGSVKKICGGDFLGPVNESAGSTRWVREVDGDLGAFGR